MAFDESLAERVRTLLRGPHELMEKWMFGGLAFMVNIHMCCGVVGKDFVVCARGRTTTMRRSLNHMRGLWISPAARCEASCTWLLKVTGQIET